MNTDAARLLRSPDLRSSRPRPRPGSRLRARDELIRLLWDEGGQRRVPAAAAFDRVVSRLPRGELEKICELHPSGPLYFIPTLPFLRALARLLHELGVRHLLEVAAGDGHLSRSLARVDPGLRIVSTDSGLWERPLARMSAADRRRMRGVEVPGLPLGQGVLRLPAEAAIRRFRPDLVLASWLPPGPLLARVVRLAPRVLEIGAGSGITGDIRAWKHPHQFLEELDALGRCRLEC